jgi:hypothetical protein
MRRYATIVLGLVLAGLISGIIPLAAFGQMVPDTVDPYELAPQNVHLYPISLNARIPYYYLPPIFAPAPMWRGALSAEQMHQFTPHNYVPYEVPESTALVAWGTVKGDKRITLEAANQQEFIVLPPEKLDDGSSFLLVKTTMRYVPRAKGADLLAMFERELLIEPTRLDSIAEQLPVDILMHNYERVEDVVDMQPQVQPALTDEMSTLPWPVDRIYLSYDGWRRDPNRQRTLGDNIPPWFTIEGKLTALKRWQGNDYVLTVEFEGYQAWYPIEFGKNVMRKMLSLSFDQFIETVPYYDFERPMEGKEWKRQGSPDMQPYDTRQRVGTGSDGQGYY